MGGKGPKTLCVIFYTFLFSIFSITNFSYYWWLLSCSFKNHVYISVKIYNLITHELSMTNIFNKTKPTVLKINNCLKLVMPIYADFSQNRLHRMESMVGILMGNRHKDYSNWMIVEHRVCGLYMYILVWQWIGIWVFELSLWVLE